MMFVQTVSKPNDRDIPSKEELEEAFDRYFGEGPESRSPDDFREAFMYMFYFLENSWRIMNFDKQEYLDCGDRGEGRQVEPILLNTMWQGEHPLLVLENLLAGSWAGDRVVFVSSDIDVVLYSYRLRGEEEWAELYRDPDAINLYPRYDLWISGNYATVSRLNLSMIAAMNELADEFGTTDLYNLPFKQVSPELEDGCGRRYLLNDAKKLYVDLSLQFPSACDYDERKGKVWFSALNPLPLLLAAVDTGGYFGYHGDNVEEEGSWVADMGHISVADEVPDGYAWYRPQFFDMLQVGDFPKAHYHGDSPALASADDVLAQELLSQAKVELIVNALRTWADKEIDTATLFAMCNTDEQMNACTGAIMEMCADINEAMEDTKE